MDSEAKLAFHERQRIQPLLMLGIVVASILISVAIKLASPNVPLVLAIAPAAVLVLIVTLVSIPTIETVVDDAGVRVRFAPFRFTDIPFDEIVSFESVTYRPLMDYGGWGVRYGSKGWAFNATGNRGVMIRTKGHAAGSGLLIGSQRPDELRDAIASRMPTQ